MTIFHRFHTMFEPIVITEIVDAKFPGITQKAVDGVEHCFGSRFITFFQNELIKKNWLANLFSSVKTILRMQTNYVDILKDSLFSYSLLRAVGGHHSIFNFLTNFSSVIILTSFALIILPLVLSTVHLVVTNPFLIFTAEKKKRGGVEMALMTITCVILSILNPILILNTLDKSKNEAESEAKKNCDEKKIRSRIQKVIEVKNHYVRHLNIELGKIFFWMQNLIRK